MITALSLAAAAPARSAAPAAGDVESDAIAAVHRTFAGLHRVDLDNGLTALILEDHAAPVVSVQVWVGVGAIHEQDHLGAGLSHFIEHMIFKGTPTRPPGAVSRELTDAGAKFNAYTTLDRTVFYADLPARTWRTGLDVLADAVQHAAFPEAEWRREREVVLREASMRRDQPDTVLYELLARTAYRVHPYRVPVIGYDEVIDRVTREDLQGFFHRQYAPDNMIVIVAGDVTAADAERALRERWTAMPRRARAPVVLPVEPPQLAPRFVRETGPYEVSRLLMVFHTVAFDHEDAPALDLLASLFGRGQSSRLTLDLRDRRRLVHQIDAWSFAPRDPGLFGVSAVFDPAKEREVVQAIEEAVASLSAAPCTAEELAKARRIAVVESLHSLQTMHGEADSLGSGQLYTGDPTFLVTALQRTCRVTPADLQAAARRYLRPENRTTAVLAPASVPAPAPAPAPALVSNAVQVLALDAGVRLVVREDHRLPFVAVCAAFRGGVGAESAGGAGLTHLMTELLTRGAHGRSAAQVAETVERLGGVLEPFAGYNSFGLRARCLRRDADVFLDLLFDALSKPAFDPGEVEQQRTLQVVALEQQQEQPLAMAMQALDRALFPSHPYRWTPLGTTNDVAAFTPDRVRAWFREQVVRGNLVIALMGDVTPEEARGWIDPRVRRVREGQAPARLLTANAPDLPARLEQRMPKDQAIFIAGFPGIALTDPRHDALEVLQTAMSGLSSRLMVTVRDERGLAYFVTSTQRAGLDPGLFAFYAGTRPDAVAQVEALVLAEAARVRVHGLDAAEIARAKSQLLAAVDMRRQDDYDLAMQTALDELYGLGADYESRTAERLAAVTPERIREVAASVLDTNRLCVSIVLPEKTAQPVP